MTHSDINNENVFELNVTFDTLGVNPAVLNIRKQTLEGGTFEKLGELQSVYLCLIALLSTR